MAKKSTPRSTKGLAAFCARIAESKLAHNVLILNLTKIEFAPTDYFVICSCDSGNQVEAIVSEVLTEARAAGIKRPRLEGIGSNIWVLADFFDVVFHIMLKESREYYKLERLWGDAEYLKISESDKVRALTKAELKSLFQ